MKLHLTQADDQYLITAFDDGLVKINLQTYTNSLILMPNILIDDWLSATPMPHALKALTVENIATIAQLNPEVVLLGTGKTHQFMHPKMVAALTQMNIAVEFMSTAAACRTYNILMSEGRNVAAALILEH